jgi:hypothetical protein
MKEERENVRLQIKALGFPFIMLLIFGGIGVVLWQVKGNIFFLFNFGYIGLAIFVGLWASMQFCRAQRSR